VGLWPGIQKKKARVSETPRASRGEAIAREPLMSFLKPTAVMPNNGNAKEIASLNILAVRPVR
jgi:hypothetical protein